MSTPQTINPAGAPRLYPPLEDAPPGPPAAEVEARQDPEHTKRDFLRDLDRATRRMGDR